MRAPRSNLRLYVSKTLIVFLNGRDRRSVGESSLTSANVARVRLHSHSPTRRPDPLWYHPRYRLSFGTHREHVHRVGGNDLCYWLRSAANETHRRDSLQRGDFGKPVREGKIGLLEVRPADTIVCIKFRANRIGWQRERERASSKRPALWFVSGSKRS
jgi:hypothetical protein